MLEFREDDLTGAGIGALLRLHLDEMHQWSPPESVHAMPVERLRQADVTFWSAWDGGVLAGCGALRHLDAGHGEIKSMRAAPAYRGKGVGRAILLHLLAEARRRGYARVSLETGRPAPFRPARRLYEAHGFVECAPFADYVLDDFSICMTRELKGEPVTDLILRAATADDIPALSALGRDSFVDKFGHMYRPQDLAAFLDETHAAEIVAQEFADPRRRYRLAEIGGALAGYCKLAIPSTLNGELAGSPHAASRPIEIKQLYTAPGMTGKGIGARLMDWAIEQARDYGADAIQLSVWSGNADAQRFYARYGFAKAADITFAVGEQIDDEFLFAVWL